jgi:hypothetical protein
MGNQETKKEKPKNVNPSELQTYVMIAQAKLTQARNKKVELIKRKVKEIVESLNNNNLEIAKAKMESILREEDYITVFDILGPLCEILKEKVTYLLYSNVCPEDLRSPVDTIIYASTRIEIDDMHKIRELLRYKFGELFVTKANSNADQLVNRNIVEKLKIKPASESLLIARLKQLCQSEGISVEWPTEIEPITTSFEPISNPNVNPYGGVPNNQMYNAYNANPYGVPQNVNMNMNQQQVQQQTNQDLSGKNLSGMNFQGINFSNQNPPQQNPYSTGYNNIYYQNPYQTYSNPSTTTNVNPNIVVPNTNQQSMSNVNMGSNVGVDPLLFPTKSIIIDTNQQMGHNISSSNVSSVSHTQHHSNNNLNVNMDYHNISNLPPNNNNPNVNLSGVNTVHSNYQDINNLNTQKYDNNFGQSDNVHSQNINPNPYSNSVQPKVDQDFPKVGETYDNSNPYGHNTVNYNENQKADDFNLPTAKGFGGHSDFPNPGTGTGGFP